MVSSPPLPNTQLRLYLKILDLYTRLRSSPRCVSTHKSSLGLCLGPQSRHHFPVCNGTPWSELVVCGILQKWLQIIPPLVTL